MSAECVTPINICRLRVTRLDAVGNPAAGANNVYCTDKVVQLGMTPVVEPGVDATLKSGCNCIIATRKGNDLLKRWDLELDLGSIEPALMEMLIGATAIIDGGDVIGNWWPDDQQFDCSNAQAPVCVEAWQEAWQADHPHPTLPYMHWVFPAMLWQIDQQSLSAEFTQPKLKGTGRGNPNWGTGIFDDLPEAAKSLGGYFLADTLPAAVCGYQTVSIT